MTMFIGVDIASKSFDVVDSNGNHLIVNNDEKAIKKWLKTLKKPTCIAMEATGKYYQLLANLAHKQGIKVFVLNPRTIHHYAKGVGRRAKTDKADAAVIMRYLRKECDEQHEWHPPTKSQLLIDDFLRRRAKLVSKRQAIRLTCQSIAGFSEQLEPALKALDKLIDELEKLAIKEINKNAELKVRMLCLKSIPGIGQITAAHLTNLFDKHHFDCADQLTSYAGMDLVCADSGQKKSRRKLSKHGPSEIRRLLFNCARAASSGKLKALYESFIGRMNHTKAIVAMMRKILKLAYWVWKSEQRFDMNKFNSPLLQNA